MKSILIGVLVSGLLALVWVLIEKHYKKKFREFARSTNDTIINLWTKYVQIEKLYGTCQVNTRRINPRTNKYEVYTFDFIGTQELCERLSKYDPDVSVNIYPKNAMEWMKGMIELEKQTQ